MDVCISLLSCYETGGQPRIGLQQGAPYMLAHQEHGLRLSVPLRAGMRRPVTSHGNADGGAAAPGKAALPKSGGKPPTTILN